MGAPVGQSDTSTTIEVRGAHGRAASGVPRVVRPEPACDLPADPRAGARFRRRARAKHLGARPRVRPVAVDGVAPREGAAAGRSDPLRQARQTVYCEPDPDALEAIEGSSTRNGGSCDGGGFAAEGWRGGASSRAAGCGCESRPSGSGWLVLTPVWAVGEYLSSGAPAAAERERQPGRLEPVDHLGRARVGLLRPAQRACHPLRPSGHRRGRRSRARAAWRALDSHRRVEARGRPARLARRADLDRDRAGSRDAAEDGAVVRVRRRDRQTEDARLLVEVRARRGGEAAIARDDGVPAADVAR